MTVVNINSNYKVRTIIRIDDAITTFMADLIDKNNRIIADGTSELPTQEKNNFRNAMLEAVNDALIMGDLSKKDRLAAISAFASNLTENLA